MQAFVRCVEELLQSTRALIVVGRFEKQGRLGLGLRVVVGGGPLPSLLYALSPLHFIFAR